jgi:hypothetical protein
MDTRIDPQAAESLRQHLRRAEVDLLQTVVRFRALRRAAFAGCYDPDEFDLAIIACRAAKANLLAARRAVHHPRPGEPRRAPDPLARLRFARWLVQTGRLSDGTV